MTVEREMNQYVHMTYVYVYEHVLIFLLLLQNTVGVLIDAAMEANTSLSNATAIEAVSQSICWVIRTCLLCASLVVKG